MTRREELERDIRLHTATLANPARIKSVFHRDNVKASLQSAKDKLEGLENV